jgi:hypothetical protein
MFSGTFGLGIFPDHELLLQVELILPTSYRDPLRLPIN